MSGQKTPVLSTPAPWRELFLQHTNSMAPPTFVLSTLHPAPASESAAASASAVSIFPRARTCIFRGLWASLLPSAHNPAPVNPEYWESDLPVITTDVRMEKASEIIGTAGQTGVAGSGGATGGGGPVEAVWWAADNGTQWRIRGTAWVLGPDVEDEVGATTREALLRRMRRKGGQNGEQSGDQEWSWEREVTAHFGNLSPVMRGTFRSPPPGSPITTPPAPGLGLGQEVEDINDAIARSNFRVVVIVPTEVDQVDLSDRERPRRWLYTYRGSSSQAQQLGGEVIGEWEKVELWP